MILERVNLKLKKNLAGSQLNSAKKTTTEEDVELNEELIKIYLEAVEKYVIAIQERKFHLSMLENREAKVCQYCNFRAILGYRKFHGSSRFGFLINFKNFKSSY